MKLLCVPAIVLLAFAAASPEARTREVLDMFFAQKYDAIYAMFSAEMKKALSPEAYKSQAGKVQSLGKVQGTGQPTVDTVRNLTVVTIPVRWSSITLNFGVSWNAAGEIAGTWFALPPPRDAGKPPYARPGSFTESEVTVGADEWKLPATLSLPGGAGPFPGVVLVHGSGPHDRDETVGGVKVFRDLAEGLASRGIAVLRYEKRTKVYAARCAADANFTMNQETVEDAVRAAGLLRTRKGVEPGRIFVLGHSQGGYMAPRIARQDPKLAGFILMAANARPLEDLLVEQSEYLAGLEGSQSPERRKQVEAIRAAAEKIRKLEAGKENQPPILGLPAKYLLDLKGYDPAAEAKAIRRPFLVLQGGRDYQVTAKDFNLWKAALGARSDVAFRIYPTLNHPFIAGEGRSSPAEYQKPGHVAAEVIDDVAGWIMAVK